MCKIENTKMDEYPFEINEVDVQTAEEVKKYFKGLRTTLTQELVWLVANDLDYATARAKHLIQRYAVLGTFTTPHSQLLIKTSKSDEFHSFHHIYQIMRSYFINPEEEVQRLKDYRQRNCNNIDILLRMVTPPTELLATSPSPRFIKCHIPLSMLPPNVLDVAKTIYVARDPRDVAVSSYHLFRQLKLFEFDGSFKTFWNFFMKGQVARGPLIEQVIEAWKQRHHSNMLFIFYEDIIYDTKTVVHKVCQFLNKNYTNEQIDCLCEHLKFENFKNNSSVNLKFLEEFNAIVPGEQSFVRKGKSGGWRDYFDEEITEQAQRWINERLDGTDLIFPNYLSP